MWAETLKFAKENYFNGYSDTRSVQENFNLITSFIQGFADKHIPSKNSRSVSSVPWITHEIRLPEKMQLMQKLRRQVVQKLDQNLKLYREKSKLILGGSMTSTWISWLVILRLIPRTFIGTSIVWKKTPKVPPLKKRNGSGSPNRNSRRQWSVHDVFTKSNRKAMNRNWSNQKANSALKTKTENK